MIQFTTPLLRFGENGDKTGWTYIEITPEQAEELNPGTRTAFRVKGKIDEHAVEGVSLIPMGEGHFIMAINASMRKAIGKRQGAQVLVRLEQDTTQFSVPPYIKECLDDEPAAAQFFAGLPVGHQRYFIRWLESAKTEATRTRRLAQMITALSRKQGYSEMVRDNKPGA